MDEEEDTVPMSEADKAKDPHRDALIKSVINGHTFKGKVEDIEVGVITRTVLYRIRYDDDDLEHYTLDQLLKVKVGDAMKRPAAATPAEEAAAKTASAAEEVQAEAKKLGFAAKLKSLSANENVKSSPAEILAELQKQNGNVPATKKALLGAMVPEKAAAVADKEEEEDEDEDEDEERKRKMQMKRKRKRTRKRWMRPPRSQQQR